MMMYERCGGVKAHFYSLNEFKSVLPGTRHPSLAIIHVVKDIAFRSQSRCHPIEAA